MRGYITPQQDGSMQLDVKPPAGVDSASLVTWAQGRRVPHTTSGASARFRVPGAAGVPTDWAITWRANRLRLPSGGRCVDRRKFSFRLHHGPGTPVVRVEVFVNGKRILRRRGHDIRRITVRR